MIKPYHGGENTTNLIVYYLIIICVLTNHRQEYKLVDFILMVIILNIFYANK